MNSGETIKKLRKKYHMTQEELGKRLGVKKAAVQKYESGDIVNLKISTIRQLCEIFDVSPSVFIFPEAEIFDQKNNLRQLQFEVKLYESIEDIFGKSSVKLISLYNSLNEDGQEKVLDLLEDYSTIEKYIK